MMTLLVIALAEQGRGDYLFGIKCAKLCQKLFPHISVTLMTNNEDVVNELSEKELHHLSVTKNVDAFDFIIQVTAFNTSFKRITSTKPTIYIHEYGHKNVDGFLKGDFATGFSSDSLGFWVDEQLKIICNRSQLPIKCLPNSKLYFGYTRCPFNSLYYLFLRTILFLEIENKHPIELVLLGDIQTLYYVLTLIKETLIQFNISKVVWKHETIDIQKEGKILILHNFNLINHKSFCQFIRASEDFICTTGDQSLSEVISAEKFFLYELLVHKRTSYRELFSNQNHPLLSTFLYSAAYSSDSLETISVWKDLKNRTLPKVWDRFDAKGLASFVKNTQFKKVYQNFCQYLKKRHNFEKKFQKIVQNKFNIFSPKNVCQIGEGNDLKTIS